MMENINDIIASLTPEDIQSLKETAQSIFGNEGEKSSGSFHNDKRSTSPFGFDFSSMPDPEMFSKLGRIMSMMNSDSGKRCRLIEALKPNLSYEKQKKADEAMQMMKLFELLPMITNLMGGDNSK